MNAAEKLNLVSVEDYLEGELISPIKHEYLGGVIHAMAGARNVHNLIASNILRPCCTHAFAANLAGLITRIQKGAHPASPHTFASTIQTSW